MTRWKAAGLHLLISAAIGAAVLVAMRLLWYSWPLLHAEGGTQLLLILLGVQLVVGPLMTLLLVRPGKRGQRLDLTVVGIVQVAALAYGLHVVFMARPAFIVFVVDRFEVARAGELEPAELSKARHAQFRRAPIGGPRFAVAEFPDDPVKKSELTLKGLAGLDLQAFPEYWSPYAERRNAILARAMTLAQARASEPQSAPVIDAWLARSGVDGAGVRFLLLSARGGWLWVAVDAGTAAPLQMLPAGTR